MQVASLPLWLCKNGKTRHLRSVIRVVAKWLHTVIADLIRNLTPRDNSDLTDGLTIKNKIADQVRNDSTVVS